MCIESRVPEIHEFKYEKKSLPQGEALTFHIYKLSILILIPVHRWRHSNFALEFFFKIISALKIVTRD